MKKAGIYVYSLFSFLIFACGENNGFQGELLGNDYRLFKGTPVWDLAKALSKNDTTEVKKIITEKKVDLNYQESKFGSTLLMLTVLNEQYSSFKILLEAGADPNIHDNHDGASAIIYAAHVEIDTINQLNYLKLLLDYGANPNDEEVGERRPGNSVRNTPLLLACSDVFKIKSPLSKVKLLVEAGANVNYKNEFNDSPLKEALIFEHLDVVLYLLHNGVDYQRAISNSEGRDYYLWDELSFILLPLDSKKHQQKMEIVEFLKQKGIDYRKTPIPDYVVKEAKKEYPKNWKEYLEKY